MIQKFELRSNSGISPYDDQCATDDFYREMLEQKGKNTMWQNFNRRRTLVSLNNTITLCSFNI